MIALAVPGLLLGYAFDLAAEEWPQFLGSQRNGTSTETTLIDQFPSTGPKVVWRTPAGAGMSAVAVADGVAYTAWNRGDSQVLVALDVKNGNKLWETTIGGAYKNQMGDGPRATPAVADGDVYAYTGDGILNRVNAKNGKGIWSVNLLEKCNVEPSDYGMSSSPLVAAGQVIVHVGGDDTAVVSVDVKSGEVLWHAGSGPAGYSSPSLSTIDGVEQVISITGSELLGIDLKSGVKLWSYPFETDYACNTANPVINGNGVFISSGENHGCVMLDVEKADAGWQVKVRWESTFTKSVMRNEWQTSIVVDGYLYGFDNVGAAGPTTHLSCIEAATGKVMWREARFGKGNMILADGKLWITTMDGALVLVNPDPSGFKTLGRSQFFEGTRQTLSIANGYGYIRSTSEVICIDLKR
jgi:outer membrane protein assembly factor BamB